MGLQRTRPSFEILSGATADVYFARANSILDREGIDPVVTMEVFCREDAVLCGMGEAANLIGHVLANEPSAVVEALADGDPVSPKEIVLRIRARYRAFALYETAVLGMLAQSTGWATAARRCVEAAAPQPVIGFGARHVHPDITDVLDYASIVGGCVGASTPAGARLAGLNPTGTMPHSLVLIFGDTVRAAEGRRRTSALLLNSRRPHAPLVADEPEIENLLFDSAVEAARPVALAGRTGKAPAASPGAARTSRATSW